MPDEGRDEPSKTKSQNLIDFTALITEDVYALLEYLSGRPEPALESQRRSNSTSLNENDDSDSSTSGTGLGKSRQDIPSRWTHFDNDNWLRLKNIINIVERFEKGDEIDAQQLAYLIIERDELNKQAEPATGYSIIFTNLVIDAILERKAKWRGAGEHQTKYRSPYQHHADRLQGAALELASWLNRYLLLMVCLLVITISASAYIACGKLLLDTRDAVNKDYGANTAFLMAVMTEPLNEAVQPDNISPQGTKSSKDFIRRFCSDQTKSKSFIVSQHCHDHDNLVSRRQEIYEQLRTWSSPIRYIFAQNLGSQRDEGDDSDEVERVAQIIAVRIGVWGNYLLPVLYGTVGSLGFILRRFNTQIANRLLTPRASRANQIRLMLGIVTGACIGLFFNSSAGQAQATGLGGAAVSLTASAVAFLAGFNVEAVFKTLEALMNHVFGLRNDER